MPNSITIFADDDIIDAIESYIGAACPSFVIGYKASSYMDCLNTPRDISQDTPRDSVNIYILQAKFSHNRG